ncbi:MAG TPA: bifunctional DNA primase/polymerase, partial [Acinetobacter sp.]|nr:bifunctional DNA primase/polymerase [Acinetobacter sp.]
MQNNKEAASSYVAHGFKLCAVRGKKPFQDKWEQNPVTDLNLFDHNGIGLIHGLSGTCTLDIDNIEHTQIALEAVGLNLALLMRDGVRIESGRLNRSKLIYKAPQGIELKRHALNWVNEVNPKESDVVFELRGGMTQDVLPPSIHPDTNKPYVWCGDWTQLPELPPELLNIWTQWDIAKDVLKSACPWHVDKEDYKAQSAPLRVFSGGDNDVIGAFNQRMGLIGLLENYGYKRITKTRMLSPHSKSKLAGCVLLTGECVDKVYIHHASDPLGDGYAHSAFGVYLYYQHNNDLKAAVKEAALLLDMDYKKPPEDETLLQQGDAIAKAFLSSNVVELKPVQVDTVKIDCSLPVDCLNEVAVWIKGQIGTAPKYSIVQATLAFACAMASRCVRLKDGTSSSAFLAIVADSAAQVQPLKGILNTAVDACGDRNIIRGTKISGSTCLHKQLLTMPRMFWATDDYAQMISFGKKQQSGAIQGALSAINEVYLNNTLYLDKDSVGANFGKKDGDGDKHISEYNIYRPSLTMLSLMSYKHIDFVAQRDQY